MQRVVLQLTEQQTQTLWTEHARTHKSVSSIVRGILDQNEKKTIALKLAGDTFRELADGLPDSRAKLACTDMLSAIDKLLGGGER